MLLNNDICSIITNNIYKPRYELISNINIKDLDYIVLSTNPNAIELLIKNKDKINWDIISIYCEDENFLRENIIYLNFNNLSLNPNAISILKENIDKINWNNLSENINAIELLIQNQDKIN